MITRETKQRFVDMLKNHEIVAVGRRINPRSNTFEYKFIGMRNGMKWDFTPCIVSELFGKVDDYLHCTCRTQRSPQDLLEMLLYSFYKNEKIESDVNIADNIACFYM